MKKGNCKLIILSMNIYLLLIIILSQGIFIINSNALSSSASEDWYKTWGENVDDDRISRIDVDNSTGDVYIAGFNENATDDSDMVLVKYNSSGIKEWEETYDGGEDGVGVGVTIDQKSKDVYLSGCTGWDFCLIKYNSSGDQEWIRTWDNTTYDVGMTTAVDSSGNIYFAGTNNYYGDAGIILMKYNSSGDLKWSKLWNMPNDDKAVDVVVDSMDNIYVAGVTETTSGYDNDIVVLLKYNSSGSLKWVETWGENDHDDTVEGLAVDSQDNIYLTGITESYGGRFDLFLLKYNSAGSELWYKTWKGAGSPGPGGKGNDIIIDSSDTIYIAAAVLYPMEFALVKYDTSGKRLSAGVWEGGGDYPKNAFSVAIDSSGKIFLGGMIQNGPVDEWDMLIVKNPSLSSLDGNDDDDDETVILGYNPFILISIIAAGIIILLYRKRYRIK